MGYTFRAMMRDDLAMAQRWLETPEVRLWWGDPDGEAGLLEGGLDEPATTMWIVSFEGRPFAYV